MADNSHMAIIFNEILNRFSIDEALYYRSRL